MERMKSTSITFVDCATTVLKLVTIPLYIHNMNWHVDWSTADSQMFDYNGISEYIHVYKCSVCRAGSARRDAARVRSAVFNLI